jgi:hypothetical protein
MPPTAAMSGDTAWRPEARAPPGKVASKTSLAASAKKNTIPTSLTQKCSGCATASYVGKSTFAQTTAATVPASNSSELSKMNRAGLRQEPGRASS